MDSIIKNFFSLSHIPFSKNTPSSELYLSSAIKEAVSRLMLAAQNEDIVLLTGAVGSGKSSALRLFTHKLDIHAFLPVYLPAYPLKIGEIAKQILVQMHIIPPSHASKVVRLLAETVSLFNRDKGIKPVVIIDEAQELPISTLQALKNIINFEMDSVSRMLLVLCGQKELCPLLDSAPLESLLRRIRIRYDMPGLTLEETFQYICHQMKVCGSAKTVFSDDVVADIFSRTKGCISSINMLCFRLILLAVTEKREIIEPSMLERVGADRSAKP